MKRVVLFVMLSIVALNILSGCDRSNDIKGAKFSSLQRCLFSIGSATELKLDLIVDTPEKVSGYLGDSGRHFACTKEITGTQNVHWDGWYEAE